MSCIRWVSSRRSTPAAWGRGWPVASIPFRSFPSEQSERQWICYQASIGSPAAEVVLSHPGLKLVDYHNISPSELIERWMPELGEEVRLGRKQLAELAPIAELGFADSEFNRAELEQAGCRRTAVAPLMVDTANFYTPADQRVTDRLRAARARGGQDWLFVGQMLPHKAHHDVIKALACARKMFDPQARLHLVGRESCPAYADALRRFVSSLELDGAVEFLGSVSSAELSAYYQGADVFVCCSDHEGFCVPLLEAMHHRLPVVAYGVTAVPETVLDAGIVLSSKSPALVATAVQRVLTDHELHDALVAAGRQRARSFTVESARRAFARAIEQVLQVA